MNEATFESRTHAALKNIFPSYTGIELTHQHIFSIKIGREDITIKSSEKKPRLDILLKHKDRNLAILELKKPGHQLTQDDKKQGLSYARLLDEMAPLVIVSNGTDTQFYETISGESIDLNGKNIEHLRTIFSNALEVAAEKKDSAIKILLGKEPSMWLKVIKDLNTKNLNDYIGPIDDFYLPISEGFQIPRQSTMQVASLLAANNPLIAVTGAPMVGKTNVLFEISRLENVGFVPIYLNALDCEYGFLQYIANYFTKHVFSATSTDDIRNWLLHSIVQSDRQDFKIVFLLDGVRHSNQQIMKDINEMIDLIGTSCSLVIACDSSNFDLIAFTEGRGGKTKFGKRVKRIEVKNLSDMEFEKATNYLDDNFSAIFHKGAIHNRQLRNPRLLRIIVSQFPTLNNPNNSIVMPVLFSYRSLNFKLEGIENDPILMDDLSKLVKSFIKNNEDSSPDALRLMVSHGRGYVERDKAEEILGMERIKRLLDQGHIEWFIDNEENQYIAPKVPELLASSSVKVLVKESSSMDLQQAIDHVLKQSARMPYGDLIAANVIEKLSSDVRFSLYEIINRLISDPPQIKRVNEDSQYAIYSDKTGMVDLPKAWFKDLPEDESLVFSNLFPWVVLSQLATAQIRNEGEEDPWFMYRLILRIVGGYNDVLRYFEVYHDLEDVLEYNTHNLRNEDGIEGRVLCGDHGIIEPITFAMQHGFYILPEEMVKICKEAVKDKDPFLCHRLQSAASSMVDIEKSDSSKAAKRALTILDRWFKE